MQLRQWDGVRANFLVTHRNFIEYILRAVDDKLRTSESFFHIIIRFFQEKAMQELNYCRHPIPKSEPSRTD
jgi:hypothetical protein